MDVTDIRAGMRVKTKNRLGKGKGLDVQKQYIKARRPQAEGVALSHVPAHGGDAWFVTHDDGSVAAYLFDELKAAESAPTEVCKEKGA